MFKNPSRIMFEREKAKERELHQSQLARVRCVIDQQNTSAMSTTSLFRQRHELLAESKQAEIDRQNNLFAKKLLKVQPTMRSNESVQNTTRAALDRNASQSIGSSSVSQSNHVNLRFNSSQRRIDEENEQYFKRISQTKSVFDIAKWAAEAKEHTKILQAHTLFPKQQQSHNQSSQPGSNSSLLHGNTSATMFDSSGLDLQPFHNKILAFTNNTNNQTNNHYLHQKDANKTSESTTSKLPPMNSLALPQSFYTTLSSDAQRSNFLKNIIRESRTVLYRKPVQVEGDMFFAEIKVEAGQFKIELENAQAEIYQLAIPEEQGLQFYRNDCSEDIETLFKRMRLNKFDKSITLIQKYLFKIKQSQSQRTISQKQSRGSHHLAATEEKSRDAGDDGSIHKGKVQGKQDPSQQKGKAQLSRKSQSQPEAKEKKGQKQSSHVALHEKIAQSSSQKEKEKEKQKQEQKQIEDNGWGEYDDPFEKFDAENEDENNNGEETNNKMNTFSFKNNTSYKVNQESDKGKNKQNHFGQDKSKAQPSQAGKSQAIGKGKQQANDAAAAKDSKANKKVDKQQPQNVKGQQSGAAGQKKAVGTAGNAAVSGKNPAKTTVPVKKEEEKNKKTQQESKKVEVTQKEEVYDDDEFYEEDSGTQYEINDEDKDIIQKKEQEGKETKKKEEDGGKKKVGEQQKQPVVVDDGDGDEYVEEVGEADEDNGGKEEQYDIEDSDVEQEEEEKKKKEPIKQKQEPEQKKQEKVDEGDDVEEEDVDYDADFD